MFRHWCRFGLLIISCLIVCSQVWAADPPVHNFHCKECHLSGLTVTELGGGNVCLKCHDLTAGDMTLNSGAPAWLDGHTDGRFSLGDASNVYGHGTGQPGAEQTSHNWAAQSDTLAAAGAQAPARSDHPEFFSRYGTSTGRITCSRCHNPHGASVANPKLLVKGDNSTDVMCKACHQSWVVNDHGWLSHPIIDSYNAAVAANPGKYRASLSNKGNADIKLVDGGVSCTSCHGVHFVDSEAATVDGVGQSLSISDGKLLRGDGPGQADKSSLCQTCHTYKEHGNSTGEKVGCLVCHSGHAYDPDTPNYFVLRKSTTTTRYNTVSGLDYSSPDVLDAGLKYTFWNDQTDGIANGYCERCHGDAKDIGGGAGSYHVASAICTDCHTHEGSTFVSHDDGAGNNCDSCHGHDGGYEYSPGLFSAGTGTSQSHSTHTENDDDDAHGPNVGCDTCHDTSSYPRLADGKSLAETTMCNPCHSDGGSYDGVNDAVIGAKSNWSSGVYAGIVLNEGKELWCIGCHDQAPAKSKNDGFGVAAPNKAGDSSTYG
ncbi:MAG: hypothetical protein DRH08_08190, partial [Deltaproteobacteria bacterium]